MRLSYFFAKVEFFLKHHESEVLSKFLRKQGVEVGNNCNIYSDIITSEPYLISIGNNVTISTDVQFITHDNSICKVDSKFTDVFGRIIVGDNTFIGARSLILPGVTIGKNVIIAAGSVVTKSIPDGKIVGGNPAKVIIEVSDFKKSIVEHGFNIDNLNQAQLRQLLLENENKLVKKRTL